MLVVLLLILCLYFRVLAAELGDFHPEEHTDDYLWRVPLLATPVGRSSTKKCASCTRNTSECLFFVP